MCTPCYPFHNLGAYDRWSDLRDNPRPHTRPSHFRGDITSPDDAPELFAAAFQQQERKSYLWGYWRKPDGYITTAPNWPTEYMMQIDEGWTSLKKYGEFLLQQSGWNVNREPYRLIFQNGGAREFTPEQVVSHNWHRRPPYKGVKFPQLDRDLVAEVTCKFCRKVFASYGVDAMHSVDANLARHESVAHKEAAQNAGLARALKDGLLDPKAAAAMPTADLSAIIAQMAETQSLILQLLAQRETPAPLARVAIPPPPKK